MTPANDNLLGNPGDFYQIPAVLVVPDEPAKIVVVAFYYLQSESWLPLLPPHHADIVERRKAGRAFPLIA